MKTFGKFLMTKFAAVFLLLAFTISTFAQTAPPKAEVREVTDVYFGQKVTDSYRWMEDLKADETQKWIKAQAVYARAYLDKLPMREEILAELDKLSDAGTRVNRIQRRGNFYFYFRRAADESDYSIYVREGLSGTERLLVDPHKIADDGKRRSIHSFSLSQDGKYLSYISSVGGGEIGELRVVETATGKQIGELIDRSRYGAGEWLPDGKSFVYNRLQKLAPDAPPSETYLKSRLLLHVLGTSADADKVLLGYEVKSNVNVAVSDIPRISIPSGSKYAFAIVDPDGPPNFELYVAPIDSLNQDSVQWRKISGFDDNISDFDVRGDDLYLITYKNAPRFKVIHINLKNVDFNKADVIFPAGEEVVQDLAAARDALYVQTLDGGSSKIYRVDYKTKKAELVKLPYQDAASIVGGYPDMDGVYFILNSWTKSLAHFLYKPKKRFRPTRISFRRFKLI